MNLHRQAAYSLAALALGACGQSFAQVRDGFSVSASYAIRHDSNLFRLPDGLDPETVLGGSSGAEDISVSSLGLRFAQNYSLQRVELNLGLVDHRYHTYSSLDLQALNYDATWRWQLTPRWRGKLFADRKESVNSFDDARSVSGSNQSVQTSTGVDALYEIDGVWRAVGGMRHNRSQSQQQLVGEDSYRTRSADIGLLYDARSGNNLSYRVRRSTGRTLAANGEPMALPRDDSFSQTDHELRARWALSGQTIAQFGLTHVARTHSSLPNRDYSGFNTSVNLNWAATGKTSWNAGWSSDLAAYQTDNSSTARSERLNLGMVWRIAPRTTLSASLAQTRRRYLGAPAGQPANPRRDTTRDEVLGIGWVATPHVSLNASLQRTQRNANLPGLAFSSTQAVLSTNAAF